MNRFKKTLLTLGVLAGFLIVGFSSVNAQGRSVSLQTFYDELSYHGDWINNPDHGYVWRPNVGDDFRPYYTNGRWIMTEYGNTWFSDYSWGWAPFHYGRWFYDDYDGWIWLPDTEWGPAWVDWRTGGGYYGWAPMGPRMSININIGRRYYPDNYWVFIPQRHIYYTGGYYNYWQPNRNVVIIRNTTIINNVYVDRGNRNTRYNSGPRADDIRRATNRNVRVYKVADANTAGSSRISRGTVNVYRPQVDRGNNATPRTVATASTSRPSRNDATGNNSGRAASVTGRNNNNNNGTPSRVNTTDGRTRDDNSRATRPTSETRGTTVDRSSGINSSESRRPERGQTSERSSSAPQRIERTPSTGPQRTERSSTPQTVERTAPSGNTERQNSAPERRPTERNSSAPQRVERPQSSGSERQSSSPQRTERSSAPQRVERSAPSSSPAPSRSSERSSGSGNGSGRSSSGSSRPSR